jgi:hypothetical protein
MLNQTSIDAVRASSFGPRFLKPLYESYCFSRIPATMASLLTGQGEEEGLPASVLGSLPRRFNKVLFLLVDGFGWRFMDEAQPFLRRFAEGGNGVVSQLTSQFPSTTTAHITTLRTGLPVGAHGLYEWFLYEPSLRDMIIPLMFSGAWEYAPDTLKQKGADPTRIYPPGPSYYEKLAVQGVTSTLFEPASIANSTYGRYTCQGAKIVGYKSLAEGLVNVGQLLKSDPGPAFVSVYYDTFDSICHKYGPDTPQARADLDTVLTTLERVLMPALAGVEDIAVILTSDHSHLTIDPPTTLHLNEVFPQLPGWLEQDPYGQPLHIGGSPRDAFLHVRPECLDEAVNTLSRRLEGHAEVFRTADLARQGFFGPVISERLLERLANLVVLSYEGTTTWWHEKSRLQNRLKGMHGGLARGEAEIPFMIQAL